MLINATHTAKEATIKVIHVGFSYNNTHAMLNADNNVIKVNIKNANVLFIVF